METYGILAIGAPLGLSLYARVGLALPALFVVLLSIIAGGIICGIPGNIPTACPRMPVLRVVSLVWRPGTGLVIQDIGFATLSAFTALWFNKCHRDNTGFAMTLFSIAFIAVRFFCAKFPDRYGGATVAAFSLLVEGTELAVMWAPPSAGAALIAAVITSCGCSLMFPSLGVEVVRRMSPEVRPSASGQRFRICPTDLPDQ